MTTDLDRQALAAQRPEGATMLDVILAEFRFVSDLIPFYRRIEMTALGSTVAITTGVMAAIAALEGADESLQDVETILLALVPWALVALMLIQIMAMTRIRRAANYINKQLRPLVSELTGREDLLRWEQVHTEMLFKGTESWGPVRWIIVFFTTSIPMILTMGLPAVLLPIAASVIRPPAGVDAIILFFGYGAAGTAIVVGFYGIGFTVWQELGPLFERQVTLGRVLKVLAGVLALLMVLGGVLVVGTARNWYSDEETPTPPQTPDQVGAFDRSLAR